MRSACIVEVQVTVNNIEKLSVEQKCFMAKLRYVAGDNKTYLGLHVMSDIFVRFKKKLGILTDLHKVSNIKFQGFASIGSRFDTCKRTDGHSKANRCFSRVCEGF